MGNKVNPIGFRIGFLKGWNNCLFCKKNDYAETFFKDCKIKNYIKEQLSNIVLTNVCIERVLDNVTVYVECPEPGIIIGKNGEKIKSLSMNLEKTFKENIAVNILETKNKSLNAKVIVASISEKINNRIPYKRAIKQNMDTTMAARAEGVKVLISGRLGGAEIARKETYCLGKISNHTLKTDIDYYCGSAETVYGTIGIKVWVNKGNFLQNKKPLLCVNKVEDGVYKNYKNNNSKSSKKF